MTREEFTEFTRPVLHKYSKPVQDATLDILVSLSTDGVGAAMKLLPPMNGSGNPVRQPRVMVMVALGRIVSEIPCFPSHLKLLVAELFSKYEEDEE